MRSRHFVKNLDYNADNFKQKNFPYRNTTFFGGPPEDLLRNQGNPEIFKMNRQLLNYLNIKFSNNLLYKIPLQKSQKTRFF